MVAGNGVVVAHVVHDVHQAGALGQGPDRAALDGVAGIHQGDPVGPVLPGQFLFVGGDGGVALGGGVDVVGMEDHNGCGV